MVQPILDSNLLSDRLSRQIEIREIKRWDPEIALMPVSEEIIESRFNQNTVCLGAYQKDKFIGYIWFSFGKYLEDEVRCTYVLIPERASVFDFDLYIFPEYRQGLGFIGIWNGANKYLSNHGINYTYSRLTSFNLASKRAHQHLGWKRIARAVILKVWVMELFFINIYPYFHVSLGETGRTRLKLQPDVLYK
jgi:hypothetical protein